MEQMRLEGWILPIPTAERLHENEASVNDNKEVNTSEVGGEVQLLTADLIREGLKFATKVVNKERNSSNQSQRRCAVGIPDPSTGDSIFDPVRNNRARLLSSSDK
ncbi:hypothetical protein TNCV_5094361 [Trichonephila clavipes]|nr:hypothetical protein TNCV_5094361 [Trichonephila clavipes]